MTHEIVKVNRNQFNISYFYQRSKSYFIFNSLLTFKLFKLLGTKNNNDYRVENSLNDVMIFGNLI